ncbi:MAG: cytidylyltransferase domain-containing protein [Candidatus Nitrosopumilus sp. bin_6a]
MIGCIIQARLGSTRLPQKVLMNIDEENPTLFYVINQLNYCKRIDKIVVATTDLKEDVLIEEFVKKLGIVCFRGNERDVLDRYYNCAKKFGFDVIVRVTADCPLIDPEIVDKIIESFEPNTEDYISNTLKNTFPKGLDIEVFTIEALERAWKEAKLPSDREHVTKFIRNNSTFKIKNYENKENFSKYRWTLDRKEDLEFIREIIKRIQKRPILMKDIMSILKQQPNLLKINSNIDPNEGINKSKLEDKMFGDS